MSIPNYQRTYSWKRENVVRLLKDLEENYSMKSEDRIRLGTLILFQNDDNEYEIIRITTLLLILLSLKENSIERKLKLRYAARESIEKIFESNLKNLDLEEYKEIAINKNIIENFLNSLDEKIDKNFISIFLKKLN